MFAFLIDLTIFFYDFQTISAELSEEWINFFPLISSSFTMSNMKYRAVVNSAGAEFDSMLKDHNAKALSRIGFVSQQMKDLEYEILRDIQDRSIETGNYECLVENQGILNNATAIAGERIMRASTEWYTELHLINDNFIGPLIHELETLMSFVMIETKMIVSQLNPVTEIQEIITGLLLEATFYELLFEIFVDEFHDDFIFFDRYSNEKNKRIFRNLENAFQDLTVSGQEIRSSLNNC